MKRFLPLLAALSLTACQLPDISIGSGMIPQAPAPLAKVTFDDSALSTAWKSHDALQDAINLYLDVKPKVIGTPAAKRMADANDAITAALTAAESAAAAGSTTDYLKALAQAKDAINQVRAAFSLLKGQ